MFWLIVFLLVLATLAYRGAPLTTATGVTGVTVLLYGWLGESLSTFGLLLLGWLAVVIPFNVTAIRQEWLALPLLLRFLDAHPVAPRAGAVPGPGATLIGGTGLLPPAVNAQPALYAEARQEALAAVLAFRLRQPLRLPQPSTPAARIAESLAVCAALQAIDLRLIEGRPTELPAREAWLLARFTAALAGSANPPALDAADDNRLTSLGLLASAHPLYPALWTAAAEDHAARRLLQFDALVWRWLGHALRNGARALVGALSFAALNPADGPEELRPLLRRLHRAQSRMAFAVDVLLGLPLLKATAPGFAARLVPALESLQAATALLAWNGLQPNPLLALPMVVNAGERALARFEDSLWAALRELESPLLRGLVTVVCLPLGRRAQTPTVAGEAAAARLLLEDAAVRARLVQGLEAGRYHDALADLDTRVRTLQALTPALQRLAAAHFEPKPDSERARIDAGLRRGILTAAEGETLQAAVAFADTLSKAGSARADAEEGEDGG